MKVKHVANNSFAFQRVLGNATIVGLFREFNSLNNKNNQGYPVPIEFALSHTPRLRAAVQ